MLLRFFQASCIQRSQNISPIQNDHCSVSLFKSIVNIRITKRCKLFRGFDLLLRPCIVYTKNKILYKLNEHNRKNINNGRVIKTAIRPTLRITYFLIYIFHIQGMKNLLYNKIARPVIDSRIIKKNTSQRIINTKKNF